MFDYLYHQIPDPYQETGGVAPRRTEISRKLYLEKVRTRQAAERRANGSTGTRLAHRIAAMTKVAVRQIFLLRLTGTAQPNQRWMR